MNETTGSWLAALDHVRFRDEAVGRNVTQLSSITSLCPTPDKLQANFCLLRLFYFQFDSLTGALKPLTNLHNNGMTYNKR